MRLIHGRRWPRVGPVTICTVAAILAFGTAANAALGTNLALNRPVSLSSNSTTSPASIGANCTDGNTVGNSPATVCQTDGAGANGYANPWIGVDLGGDFPIESIKLTNRIDACTNCNHWLVVVAGDSSLTPPTNLATVYAQPRYFQYVYSGASANGTYGSFSIANGGTTKGPDWTGTLTIPTGLRKAAWVRIFQRDLTTAGGVLTFAEIAVIEGIPFQRRIVNGSFEQLAPQWPVTGTKLFAHNEVSAGWSTTDQANVFEVWSNSFNCETSGGCHYDFPAFDGSQMIELNAYTQGAISQSVCVFPGESLQWTLAHHARMVQPTSAASTKPPQPAPPDNVVGGWKSDRIKLTIDGVDMVTMEDNTSWSSTSVHTCAVSQSPQAAAAAPTCVRHTPQSDPWGWQRYNGSWTNPPSNTTPKAVTFELVAVDAASSVLDKGNLIDAFDLTGLAATVELSAAMATGPLPTLLVNGVVPPPGRTVQIAITGTAIPGIDYLPATTTVTVTIPQGTYDGTATSAISLTPPFQILSGASAGKTLQLILTGAEPGVVLGGADRCDTGTRTTTYTIAGSTACTLMGNIVSGCCLGRVPCVGNGNPSSFYSFLASVTLAGTASCQLTMTSTTSGLVLGSYGPSTLVAGANFVTGTFSAPNASTPYSLNLSCAGIGGTLCSMTLSAPLPACEEWSNSINI